MTRLFKIGLLFNDFFGYGLVVRLYVRSRVVFVSLRCLDTVSLVTSSMVMGFLYNRFKYGYTIGLVE